RRTGAQTHGRRLAARSHRTEPSAQRAGGARSDHDGGIGRLAAGAGLERRAAAPPAARGRPQLRARRMRGPRLTRSPTAGATRQYVHGLFMAWVADTPRM